MSLSLHELFNGGSSILVHRFTSSCIPVCLCRQLLLFPCSFIRRFAFFLLHLQIFISSNLSTHSLPTFLGAKSSAVLGPSSSRNRKSTSFLTYLWSAQGSCFFSSPRIFPLLNAYRSATICFLYLSMTEETWTVNQSGCIIHSLLCLPHLRSRRCSLRRPLHRPSWIPLHPQRSLCSPAETRKLHSAAIQLISFFFHGFSNSSSPVTLSWFLVQG